MNSDILYESQVVDFVGYLELAHPSINMDKVSERISRLQQKNSY